MSQVQDESLNSAESDDNNDDEHVTHRNDATDSGSGNDTDSDSDDDSGSSTESSDGHNSPEPHADDENACDAQQHFQQRKDHTAVSNSVPKTIAVTGHPPSLSAHQQGNSKTNGYNDENDDNNSSDSESNSDSSDSNSDDDENERVSGNPVEPAEGDAKAPRNSSISEALNKANESGVTNSTNNTTATTDHNTSHTSIDDEDDEDDNNDSPNEEDDDARKASTNSSSDSSNDDSNADDNNMHESKPKAKRQSANSKMTEAARNASKGSSVNATTGKSRNIAKSFADSDSNDDDDVANAHNEDNGSESAETTKSDESFANSEPTESSSSSSSEDEEDDYQPKRSTRTARKPTRNAADKAKPPPAKKQRKKNWVSDESDESDENSDASANAAPPKRKPPKAKVQKRRTKKPYSSDDSEDDSKRCGTRRKAAAVSYKEPSENEQTDSEDLLEVDYDESQQAAAAAAAEEEEKSETIERVLAKRQGKKGCTGNQTTIYAIEESGIDPNEGADKLPVEETELQYHIKWKGWSYIHNTWESEDTLRDQKVKGMKKLENFIKKEQEVDYWRRYAGPEDIDYFECQLELQNDLLKSYNNVDRIIARNEKPEGANEYLCKWQSLPYAEATWEDASLVMRKWNRCVEQFEEREMSKCTPSRHCKVLKYRPKFYKIKEQPDFLAEGLLLRDYQMDGLNWLLHAWCKENSVILADEMGLGKTIQTICFLYSLFKTHHLYGPFLCVVPLSTMTAWQREFELWAPGMNVVTYLGDVKSREMIRQYEWQFDGSKRLKFNCILTTYEIVLKDKIFLGTLQWAALLVDEAHRLKNDDSLLYKSLKEFATNHRLLITGTPLQNSLKELWALLHFIMPEKFITWENFEMEHGDAADKGYHKLHQQLEPYILRRVKKDVEKSLPAKVEQILRVEMTSMQKQYYKWILTKNFEALRKGKKGSTSTFLNIVIELKKCCNHAALIRPSEFDLHGMLQDEALQTLLKGSGKLVLLDKLLCRLKETGHRVLIFSQMVRMLDVLADYLQKRHFSFQRLDGSIKGEMRKQALDHFNADGSQDFCFLLSTRAGGLGINLATADTVIIFDSDWNPQNDLQAQARAHRIGQKNQVNIYRLVTARSVEENIVERAKQKMVLDHLVIQRMDTTGRTVLDKTSGGASSNTNPFNKDDLSAILKFGAEELFKDEQENDDELVCDIDEILRRAETRNDDPEMPGDDLLSAFKVASIVAFEEEPNETPKDSSTGGAGDEDDTKDWDDIIPENFRQVVENEERVKEMEDLYLPPRRKTAANNDTPTKRGRRSQQDGSDSDEDMGSDASGDDGRPKRRGRPAMKEKINGFTDAEIRRFIRSYKKFPAPLLRLEAIACDAELQEKPLAELKRIGEMLHDRCVHLLEEHKDEITAPAKSDETAAAKQKRTRSTFSLKLGGVSFNAKTLLTCEEELKPLNEIIPSAANERASWALNIKTRPANFDVDWGVDEDSKLLCGIYQYGIGSWEQMKMDPDLKLTEKILFNDTRKPQAKHLQSRAEYLLKIIKKNLELKKGVERKQRKPRKPREAKTGAAGSTGVGGATASNATTGTSTVTNAGNESSKLRKISESHAEDISMSGNDATQDRKLRQTADNATNADGTANDTDTTTTTITTKKKSKRNAAANKEAKASGGSTNASGLNDSKVSSSRTKKTSISDKTNKPMHFTANNEPRALEVLGDLDPTVFNECKEKMRPVKKSLKALDRPDSSLSTEQQDENTRQCLLAIGKQIDICLEAYSEPEKREWRSNLWYFVSKFTEFDARKLFKLYKNTLKSTEEGGNEKLDKSATKSPVKSATKEENGKVKDKSTKKKKKDKDKAKDNDKSKTRDRDSTSNNDSFQGFDKVKRNSLLDTPIKRKRDDMASSTPGSGIGLHDGKNSYKRMVMDRSRDDRKKHYRDDYYGGGNSHDDYDRRNQLNSPSNSRLGNASRIPPGTPSGYNPAGSEGKDRWGHSRDRYGNSSDFKRDRYDSYNSRSGGGGGGGYHRGDHRDRDRRPDKRRYPPSHLMPHPAHNYPPHYMAPNLYMGNGIMPPGGGMSHMGYRGDPRYAAAGDWPRDYPPDYRRSGGGSSGIASGGGGGSGDRRTQT